MHSRTRNNWRGELMHENNIERVVVSRKQAAMALGVSVDTIKRLEKSGEL
jgi:hypothetical protein